MLLGETNEKLTANLPDLEPSHSKKNKNKKKMQIHRFLDIELKRMT